MAEKLSIGETGGSWHIFSGNQLGVLLGHWCIQRLRAAAAPSNPVAKAAVLASVVSSRMLKHIATVEGVQYHDTLTGQPYAYVDIYIYCLHSTNLFVPSGFKWLGNRALELRADGVDVLFAFEEALGYCVGDAVCDKDGLSAAAVFLEMASQLKAQGISVVEHYRALEAKYGIFVSYNSYVLCYDPAITDKIFARLRDGRPDGGYWTECCGCRIVALKDVTRGYDSTSADHQSALPATPDSHMIMYEFDNGVTVTLRTSGTEPKIKFYTEIAVAPGQTREALEGQLHAFVDGLVNMMLQPDLHKLIRPS